MNGACGTNYVRGERGLGSVLGSFSTMASLGEGWLPDMDLNHDKQIQSLLCYRYTIGQSIGG